MPFGNLKLYIALFALAIALGGGFLIKWQHSRIEELKTTLTVLEAQNADILKQANKFANRPKSNNDVTNSLCQRARAAEQSENPTIKRLPVRTCP